MKKGKFNKLTEQIYSSVNNHLKGYRSRGRRLQTYLEIGDDYLKILQIKDNQIVYNQSHLTHLQKISAYLAELKYNPQDLILVIPSSKLFVEILELPNASKEKLRNILRFKFLDKLPSREEEVYFSYYIIEKLKDGVIVLAFAVLKEFLNPIYYSCYEEGVKISSIIPAALIYYLYHQNNLNNYKEILYIDKGTNYYNFIFFSKKNCYIRASRSLDLQEEVAKSTSYLQRRYKLAEAPLVVINGTKVAGSSNLKEEDYEVNDQIWFYGAEAVEGFKGNCLMHYFYDKKQEYIIINSIIIVIILLINLLSFGVNWKVDNDKLAALDAKLSKLNPVIRQIDQVKGEYSRINQQIKDLEDNINQTYNYLPWLEELSRILPNGTKIDQIHFKDYQLNLLTGTAPSAIGVMNSLEESGYFNNLEFIGNIINQGDGEQFKIVGELVDETK
jgi:hypothetical protein